ncbi:hypothetical protein N7508_001933 [Penicillium antarcticum]|uniref:uncharacterized protein n=1 Tax=Penicillium antarcticum TaxID=416450 RepID=UPI00238EEADF|nr:uncharacterized protein N7508_001933 [Penicillium antarcticum]KAJ5317425.1 hypothetical protein N7508_001933 [Penicillium antarcticum]
MPSQTSLMKKAYEYSKLCSADVFVGIRIRETGQRILRDFGLSLARNWHVSNYGSDEKTTDLSRTPTIQSQ